MSVIESAASLDSLSFNKEFVIFILVTFNYILEVCVNWIVPEI